jgi:hypothetical protein
VASTTGGNEAGGNAAGGKSGECKRPGGDIGLAEWLEVGLTMVSIAK